MITVAMVMFGERGDMAKVKKNLKNCEQSYWEEESLRYRQNKGQYKVENAHGR